MADLAKLVVKLEAESSKLRSELERANAKLDRFGKNTQRTAAIATKAFGVLGTAVAAVQFTRLISDAVDAGDKLQKMSIRLGASTEALSQLRHVADLSGVSFETLTMGLQRMTRRVSEAANGTGEAVGALDELGVSAKRLESLRPDQQFEVLAQKLSEVKDQSDKVRLAMKLFDSEGVALLQTMEGGAAGIQSMRQEADRLGLTLSRAAADEMAAFDDNLTRLSATVNALSIKIAGPLVAGINGLIIKLSQATESGITFNNVLKGLSNFIFDTGELRTFTKQIDGLNEKIAHQKEKINVLKNEGGIGGLIDGLLGYDIGEERRKLDLLLRDRANLIEEFNKKQKETLNSVFDSGVDLSSGESNKPQKSLTKGIKETAKAMEQMTGPASEWTNLLNEADRVIEQTRTPLENLNREIELYSTLAERSMISQEVLNRALTDAGERYNRLTDDLDKVGEKAAESSNQMSVYAEQAARNIQDAFAEFLFDPFSKGLDEMALDFVNVIRRMAAENLSALIVDNAAEFGSSLLGQLMPDSGGQDAAGQVVGGVAQVAGAALGVGGGQEGGAGVTPGDQLITDAVTGTSQNSTSQMIAQLLGLGTTVTTAAVTTDSSTAAALATQTTALTGALGLQTNAIVGAILGSAGADAVGNAAGAAGGAAGGVAGAAGEAGAGSSVGAIGGIISSLFSIYSSVSQAHSGKVIGSAGGIQRKIDPGLFNGAPRFHDGGFPGLKAGELPIIVKKREEVLSPEDPRNALNGGLNNKQSSGGNNMGTRIVNVVDKDMARDFMESSAGEEVLINVISRNATQIQQILR